MVPVPDIDHHQHSPPRIAPDEVERMLDQVVTMSLPFPKDLSSGQPGNQQIQLDSMATLAPPLDRGLLRSE